MTKDSLNVFALIARREIEILNCLNKDPSDSMINLIDTSEDNNDIWLVFEKGGRSLSTLLFKIKGEFLKDERIYSIKKGYFLMYLFQDITLFKKFIKQILAFICFLNSHGIVHCDLKPENILVDFNVEESKMEIKSVKIIDFGSSFFISNPDNFSSNTPEYMSPEITELIEKNASSKDITNFLKGLKSWPWCIDMWSLGVTILEIILSCPLWMNYKAKVTINGKIIYKTGLFGVKGRNGAKIHSKQMELAPTISKLVNESLLKDDNDKKLLTDLLSGILDLNYKTRMNPTVALNHPFFENIDI
jgi:serine/threonine protein kinase